MGKLKLNKDGLKGIFINHIEKMVLVMVLLVFGLFVYSSLGLEGLPSNETPDVLKKSAESAQQKIVDPANAKEVLASVTISSGYKKRVDDGLIPTESDLYASVKPVSPSYGQDGLKRQDPKLFTPEKVEVYAVTGPVAYMMKTLEDDTLSKEDNSVVKPKAEPKKPSAKKKGNDPYGMGMGMEGMDPGMAGGGMSGGAGGYGGMPGAGVPGMDAGIPGMGAMPSMGGMPGMPGMPGGPGQTPGITASMQGRQGFIAGQGAVARSKSFIAVKALVPWKKQWEEFDQKFSTAMGYNPSRDTPRYFSFRAERIEVGNDPAAPLDWSTAIKVAFTNRLRTEFQTSGFAGVPQEIADPRYVQLGVLTFPVPPLMNRDLEPLALHKDVPKVAQAAIQEMKAMKEKMDEAQKKALEKRKKSGENDEPGDLMPSGMAGVGTGMPGMGMPGMGGDSGMGMPGMGMPGMGMPGMGGDAGMGGVPGMGVPGMGGDGGMGMPGMGMPSMGMPSMGMPSMGMPGMGMPGMGGDSAMGVPGMGVPGMGGMGDPYGGMSGAGMNRGPTVPYLLVRFFDFSAEPGKKYRYRVQVVLEDPNHPQYPQLEPSDRYLDDTVKVRLGKVTLDEKNSKSKSRIFFLTTDWSEPSDPVEIEIKSQSLAGAVAPVKVTPLILPLPEKWQDKIIVDEPTAKVMSVVWNDAFAVDVAAVSDVMRGTYLNFITDGDAIHPVYMVYKSLKKYDFATNRLVADIRGGEELPGADKPLAPGQYALVDETGQIIVHNELDDYDRLKALALPEAPESGYGGMAGGDGSLPGMEGDAGMGMAGGMIMPGMGGPGKGGKTKKAARGRGNSSDN